MSEPTFINTTGLLHLRSQENSMYKSTSYLVTECELINDHPTVDMYKTKTQLSEENGVKQLLYIFECGCQHVSELITKELQ